MCNPCPVCHGKGIKHTRSMSLEGEWDREPCWLCKGVGTLPKIDLSELLPPATVISLEPTPVPYSLGNPKYTSPDKDGWGVHFHLLDYLRDCDEIHRRNAWEKTFGRKEKYE